MVKFDGSYVRNVFDRHLGDEETLKKELSMELDDILLHHPGSAIVFEYIETEVMFRSLSAIDERIGLFQ